MDRAQADLARAFPPDQDIRIVDGNSREEAVDDGVFRMKIKVEAAFNIAQVNKRGQIELDLMDQHLTSLTPEIFNFVRVQVLRASKNSLVRLSHRVGQLRRLKELDLSTNQVATLPDTLANCSHLRVMDLSDNGLSSLPAAIARLQYLRVVKLGKNKFEELPHCVGQLVRLHHLELQSNQLSSLPFTIKKLKSHLITLNLSDNHFTLVPDLVCGLTHITTLNLSSNQLTHLPTAVQELKSLREFNLSDNRFEVFPEQLLTVRSLHSLYMDNNSIASVPYQLGRLGKLTHLHLRENRVLAFASDTGSVQHLDLAKNRIKSMSVDRMLALRHLDVSHNMMESLPLGLYQLRHLQRFFCQYNQVVIIPPDIRLMRTLRSLDLSFNRITALPTEVGGLGNLDFLNIEGNPMTTDQGGTEVADQSVVNAVKMAEEEKGESDEQSTTMKDLSERTASQRYHYRDATCLADKEVLSSRYSQQKEAWESSIDHVDIVNQSGLMSSIPCLSPQSFNTSGSSTITPPITNHNNAIPLQPSNGHIHLSHSLPRHQNLHDLVYRRQEQPYSAPHRERQNSGRRGETDDDDGRLQDMRVMRADHALLGVCSRMERLMHSRSLSDDVIRQRRCGEMEELGPPVRSSSKNRPPSESGHMIQNRPDIFKVGPAGGTFSSTIDHNIRIQFPSNCVSRKVEVSMQLEMIDDGVVQSLKGRSPLTCDLISMGHILHLTLLQPCVFYTKVTLTVPAPPVLGRSGRLHLISHREDGSCQPCTSGYTTHNGYVTMQAWNFAGYKETYSK